MSSSSMRPARPLCSAQPRSLGLCTLAVAQPCVCGPAAEVGWLSPAAWRQIGETRKPHQMHHSSSMKTSKQIDRRSWLTNRRWVEGDRATKATKKIKEKPEDALRAEAEAACGSSRSPAPSVALTHPCTVHSALLQLSATHALSSRSTP